MYADRDLCSALLSSAVDFFGAGTLAIILNVPESEVRRWVRERVRPSPRHLLQVVDLMRPRGSDRGLEGRAPALKVLVATSHRGHAEVARIVAGCPVELAGTLEEGEQALRRHAYSHVVIGYFFAGSRMLDFAREVRRLQPAARLLCVKAAGGPLRPDVRTGLDAAIVELGGEGFFDLTAGETPGAFPGAFDEILALA